MLINTSWKDGARDIRGFNLPKGQRKSRAARKQNQRPAGNTQNKTSGDELQATTSLETTSKLCTKSSRAALRSQTKPSGSSPRRGQVHLTAATRLGWYSDCGLATRSSACDQPGAHTEGTLWGVKQKLSRTGQRKQKGPAKSGEGQSQESQTAHLTPCANYGRGAQWSQQIFTLPPPECLRPHSSHKSEPLKGWTLDKLP